MKKQLFGLAICSCVLLCTSCSSDEFVNIISPEQIIEPTYVTASVGADTRLIFDDSEIGDSRGTLLKVNWRDEANTNPEIFYGAGFTEGKGLKFTQTGALVGKESQFLVEGYTSAWENDALTDGNTYHLLYPAKSTYASSFESTDLSTVEITLSLEGQTGKLTDLENYNYMTCVATKGEGNLDIKFTNRISIIHLEKGMQFKGISAATTVTDITLSGACIFSSAKLNMSGSTADISFGDTPDDIVTTGSFAIDADGKLAEHVYIAFIPNAETSGEALTITAKVGLNIYKLGKATTPTFNQGQLYTLDGELEQTTIYKGTFAEFINALPNGSTIIITDEELGDVDPNKFKDAVSAGNISVVCPNLIKVGESFMYKAQYVDSLSCPKLEECGSLFGRGDTGALTTFEYINLPRLKKIGGRFLQRCDSFLHTLIVGTEVEKELEIDESYFLNGTDLSGVNLYLNSVEYENKVSNKKWRGKGAFNSINP